MLQENRNLQLPLTIISTILFILITIITQNTVFASPLKVKQVCTDTIYKDDVEYDYSFQCNETEIVKTVYYKLKPIKKIQYFLTTTLDLTKKNNLIPNIDAFQVTDLESSHLYNYSTYDYLELPQIKVQPFILNVAVLDDGFDVHHPSIKDNLLINDKESFNLIDSDANGFVDDIYGLSYQKPKTINNITAPITLTKDRQAPFSHGTHVASIITKNHSDTSLSLYKTSTTDEIDFSAFHPHITQSLKQRNIRAMNISIGTSMILGGSPPVQAKIMAEYNKLKKDYTDFMEDNPNVLFLIAAGNGNIFGHSANLDRQQLPSVPAACTPTEENTLVVGALNTGVYNPMISNSYKLTNFSNFGVKTVDILAPGENVIGANLGEGSVEESGTSMATPWVLNQIIIPLLKINPTLSNKELKLLTLTGVNIPNISKPMNVKSGGSANPTRSLKLAQCYRTKKLIDCIYSVYTSSGFSKDQIDQRINLWKQREVL